MSRTDSTWIGHAETVGDAAAFVVCQPHRDEEPGRRRTHHSRAGRPTLATVRKMANDHSTDTRSMMMPLAKNHHTYATTYTPISDQRILTHSMPAVRKAPAYSAIADRPMSEYQSTRHRPELEIASNMVRKRYWSTVSSLAPENSPIAEPAILRRSAMVRARLVRTRARCWRYSTLALRSPVGSACAQPRRQRLRWTRRLRWRHYACRKNRHGAHVDEADTRLGSVAPRSHADNCPVLGAAVELLEAPAGPVHLGNADLGEHLIGCQRSRQEALEKSPAAISRVPFGPWATRRSHHRQSGVRAGRMLSRCAQLSHRWCRGDAPAGHRRGLRRGRVVARVA